MEIGDVGYQRKRGSKSRRKLAKKESRQHQKIAGSCKYFSDQTARKLVRAGAKLFFHEELNLKGLTKGNQVKQDEDGKYFLHRAANSPTS